MANKRSQLTCFTPLYRLRQVISIDPFSRQCRDIRAIFRVLWRQGSNIRLPVVSNNCRLPERKLRYCLGNPNGLTEWRHVRSRIWYLCYDMCVHAERKSPVVDLGLSVTVSSICRTFHSISTNLVFKKKKKYLFLKIGQPNAHFSPQKEGFHIIYILSKAYLNSMSTLINRKQYKTEAFQLYIFGGKR